MGRGEKHRYSMELTPQLDELLDKLQVSYGCRARVDLIQLGATVLNWAAKQKQVGRVIGSMDDGTSIFRELMIPMYQVEEFGDAAPDARQSHKSASSTRELCNSVAKKTKRRSTARESTTPA